MLHVDCKKRRQSCTGKLEPPTRSGSMDQGIRRRQASSMLRNGLYISWWCMVFPIPLHWRDHERNGVSNHEPHDCFLNRLFRRRSNKTSKLASLAFVWWPMNSPSQRAKNAENVSIWWRLHANMVNVRSIYAYDTNNQNIVITDMILKRSEILFRRLVYII